MLGSYYNALDQRLGRAKGSDSQSFNPYTIAGMEAYYDFTDTYSLTADASNRVSYAADKSGNSAVMGLALPGTAGNYASTPAAVPIQITGAIDLRVEIAMDAAIPASDMEIIGSIASSTAGGYAFDWLSVSGKLKLTWSNAGGLGSVTSSVAVPATNFNYISVRVGFDPTTGTGTFYTSTDHGATWVQLGSPQVAGATSITASSVALRVGASPFGAGGQFVAGKIYRAQIYNGIAGTLVFDANFSAQARGTTSFAESSSNAATVTVNTSGDLGARICGARDLAQLTGSKQPQILPWSGANYLANFGVAANNASTPDVSSFYGITGSFDVDAQIAAADYANAGKIIGKDEAAKRTFSFFSGFSGAAKIGVELYDSAGTSLNGLQSSVVTGFAAYSINYVRAKIVWALAGNISVTFYTSPDGVTWTQLGTVVTAAATGNPIGAFNNILTVGARNYGGANDPFNGRIYKVRLYSGDRDAGGVLKMNFDASQAVHNATSWVSSTGETWTLAQSGAKPAQIVGRQTLMFDGTSWYMKAPPFALNQPTTVVLVGKQNTWAATRGIFDGNVDDTLEAVQHTDTPKFAIFAGTTATDNAGWTLGINAVVEGVFSGASSLSRVNRTAAVTSNAGANNAGGFTLGNFGTTNAPAAIQASHVFIFSQALDTSTLDRLGAWLAARDLVPNF